MRMNKVIWKDNLREIRKSFPRFLSIFAIIALGVAFFVGIRATGPSMLNTARIHFESYRLPDGQILSTLGLEDEDIDILMQEEGITVLPMQSVQATIQPSNQYGKILTYNGEEKTNFYKVVEGRLPEADNEIALDRKYLDGQIDVMVEIGDTVNLEADESNSEDDTTAPHFKNSSFEVVGYVETPIYFERISRGQGGNNVFAVVTDTAVAGDIYTEAYYWVDAASQFDAYTDEYNQAVNSVHESLEVAFDGRPEVRFASLQNEINEAIADGQAEIDDGYRQLSDGAAALTEAEKELQQGWQDYYAGLDELAKGEADFKEGLIAYQEGVDDYKAGLADLESAEALLVENQASYDAGFAEYQNGLQAYYNGIALGEETLINNQALLNQVQAELASGYQELVAGQEALDLGRQELISGRQQFMNEIIGSVSNGDMTSEELVGAISSQREQIQAAQAALQTQIEQSDNAELIDQLTQAKNQLAELDQFMGQSEGLLTQLLAGEISLEQAREELVAENEELKALLEGLGLSTDISLADLLAELGSQRETIVAEIDRLEKELATLPEQIQTLEGKIASLDAEISQLEILTLDNQTAVDAQQQLVQTAESDWYYQQEILASQQNQLNDQQVYLDSLYSQRAALLADPENNQAQIDSLNAEISQAEIEFANSQAAVEAQTNVTYQAESNFQQASVALENLQAEKANNQSRLEDLRAERDQKQAELNQLREIDRNLDYDALQAQLDELRAQEKELNEQMTLLTEAVDQLNQAEAEITQGQAALDQGWESYYSGLAQYQAGQAALDNGWSVFETERAQGLAALNQAAKELESGRQQLEAGWEEFYAGQAELEAGYEELLEAKEEIIDGYASLQAGRDEAMDGRMALEIGQENLRASQIAFNKEANKAMVDLRQGQIDLNDAKIALEDLTAPIYFVNQRDSFDAYQSVYENAQQITVISNIFPVFFFGIAILVTFTTIKRMASEQRNYMGTMKQMGYPNHVILSKFISYAGLASILGVIVGIILGYVIFPPVIVNAYNSLFYFDTPIVENSILLNISVAIIGIGCALIPAITTPYGILKTQAALLLQPEPPKAGKKTLIERATFLWRRLSYKTQMTIRNLLRYKGRNSMTVIGVAGCTMLIVTGFGISTTISNIVSAQFDDLHGYDSILMLEDDLSESELSDFQALVDQKADIELYNQAYTVNYDTNTQEASQSVSVIVPMDDNFTEIITIRERDAESTLDLFTTGPVITERLAEYLNIGVGDTFHLQDSNNQPYEIKVGAITENYIGHYLYMTQADFEEIFEDEPITNSYYLAYQADTDQALFEEEISEEASVLAVVNVETISSSAKNSMESLDLITIVLIISAAGLAFVVLYNLTNINVAERMRELSTIKVLGFYNREVTMYIASEVLVLTFIGSLIGLGLGTVLNHYIMKTMQLNNLLFYPRITIMDYILSVIITFVFASIVMLAMHFKLKKIDMVEALKAVE